MRIRTLELAGFKSFPQKTVLEFPRGVTGIVGPNGCGKSNVVDSIRWVLGEQSPKHLRGDAMEAVIFNGNERQAPLGMAEVSLTFENDGIRPAPSDLDLEVSTLPSFIHSASEIMITRRYYRSGESEYFINKTPCRLKDITELFLGTGVGTKAYGIIEQGRVDQLVNAKPEERRLFIEEAAGTTLYRSRKLAAERKMERARENLARVNDILAEIGRQVHYLERQAKKAEEYRRLQQEIRQLELGLARDQWQRLHADLASLGEQLQQLVDEEAQLRTALAEAEAAQDVAQEAVTTAEQRQAYVRERLAVLDAERDSVREQSRLLALEREERERRRVRLDEELQITRSQEADLTGALERADRECLQMADSRDAQERDLIRHEAELTEARTVANAVQAELEAAKSALVDHLTREVEVRNAMAALTRRREELARQLDRRRTEEEECAERQRVIAAELARRTADLEAARQRLTLNTGEKEACAHRLHGLIEARRRWEREAVDLEAQVVQTRSRLESLDQIQQNYEGYQRGVRAIMRAEAHPDGVVGVVAEVLDAPAEVERAVAAVLGDRLQYIIVQTEEAAAGAVNLLREESGGRGSFIPLEPRQIKLNAYVSLNGSTRRLLDLVQVDAAYHAIAESLLGEVWLVPDLATGLALYRKNGVHVTFVTPQGDVIHPSGVITGGSDRPIEEEILSRRREIDSLRTTQTGADAHVAAVRAEIATINESVAATESALKALDDGVHALMMDIVGIEKDLERLGLEQPQCASRLDVLRYEAEQLRAEDYTAAMDLETAQQRLAGLTDEHDRLERQVATLRAAVTAAQEQGDTLNGAVTAAKVRVAECRERELAATATASALRQQLGDAIARIERAVRELETTTQARDELDIQIQGLERRLVEQAVQRDSLHTEVSEAAAHVEQVGLAYRDAAQRVRDMQQRMDEARERRAQLEINRSELRLRLEHLVDAMREKYAIDVALPSDDPAIDGAAASERLEPLKARLARLGEVNVGAIDELREFNERSVALRAQKDDLENALQHLERTIQKLNRASRTRFAETFAKANEIFQQVFPRLFRGGEARLVLTDENNLLETGVEIVVRPPGKRLDSVALLSGGERALVAVSLIFSLFLINPTPFCVLDEVDAPLDDANVGRFNQMVREMSAQSQFIIITHNKRSMESADVLYGVTMQEPGVSKVISVNIA